MVELWKKTWGIILIAVGIIGLALPLIPGIPLIALGATLLSHKHLVASIRKKLKQNK